MCGRFDALVATIAHPRAWFDAVAVHLEVHRTRRHRDEQMRVLLEALADPARPTVLAGDWNTHTFDRGRSLSPLATAWTLLASAGASLRERLRHPDRGPHREPLFDRLRAARFVWDETTKREPTLWVRADRLEELRKLPRSFGPLFERW